MEKSLGIGQVLGNIKILFFPLLNLQTEVILDARL